jgi:hypothetical protein
MSVDIVNLIESNPITKLNGNYQSKLITKVQNNFNNYEQQMFIASFYCYLNYDYENDYVIDLDNIWQWLGFGQKVNAKHGSHTGGFSLKGTTSYVPVFVMNASTFLQATRNGHHVLVSPRAHVHARQSNSLWVLCGHTHV